jgi:hypothetical protein
MPVRFIEVHFARLLNHGWVEHLPKSTLRSKSAVGYDTAVLTATS